MFKDPCPHNAGPPVRGPINPIFIVSFD